MGMSQHEIELILARNLSEHLAMPVFFVAPAGDLLFYTEPAEVVLGSRFDETGPMPVGRWSTIFQPVDQDGRPLSPEELPLVVALTTRPPPHKSFWIRGLDDALRQIAVTAFPLIGQADRYLGAVAIFWEIP